MAGGLFLPPLVRDSAAVSDRRGAGERRSTAIYSVHLLASDVPLTFCSGGLLLTGATRLGRHIPCRVLAAARELSTQRSF